MSTGHLECGGSLTSEEALLTAKEQELAAGEADAACEELLTDPEALLASDEHSHTNMAGGARLRRRLLFLQHNDMERFSSMYKTAAHQVRRLSGLSDEIASPEADAIARVLLPALACNCAQAGGELVRRVFDELQYLANKRLEMLVVEAEEAYESLGLGAMLGAVASMTRIERQDDIYPVSWFQDGRAAVSQSKFSRDFDEVAALGAGGTAQPVRAKKNSKQRSVPRPQLPGVVAADENKAQNVYISLLLAQAHALDGPFQDAVAAVCASTACVYRHLRAPTKRPSRIQAKLKNEYKGTREPRAAHVLDLMRCLVACADAAGVLSVVEAMKVRFDVVRIKNSFCSDGLDDRRGWRCVTLNVVIAQGRCRQIAEVQVSVDAIVAARSRMHSMYSIVRAEHPRDLR